MLSTFDKAVAGNTFTKLPNIFNYGRYKTSSHFKTQEKEQYNSFIPRVGIMYILVVEENGSGCCQSTFKLECVIF